MPRRGGGDPVVVMSGAPVLLGWDEAQQVWLARHSLLPLGHHLEQTFHVPHRLARYGAGRRMDYNTATAEVIASAIAEGGGRPMAYRSG